jgi:hypothetical protein
MMMNKRDIYALSGIRNHGLSDQVINAYVSDHVATGTGGSQCCATTTTTLVIRVAYRLGKTRERERYGPAVPNAAQQQQQQQQYWPCELPTT